MITLLLAVLAVQDAETLVRQLGDEDPKVRDAATASLKKLEPDSTTLDARLKKVAASEDLEASTRAKGVLAYRRLARGVKDIDALLSDLASEKSPDRARAATVLVGQGEEAIPFLVPLAMDVNEFVRKMAVARLGELATPECVAALREVLKHVPIAARTVARPQPPVFRPPELIGSEPVKPTPGSANNQALQALIKLKDPAAEELVFALLERTVETPSFIQPADYTRGAPWAAKHDPALVWPAIEAAAGPYRGMRSLALFEKMFPGAFDHTKAEILKAVVDWKEAQDSLHPAVLKAIDEWDPSWVKEAIEPLIRFGWNDLNPRFRALASHSDYTVVACRFLGSVKDVDAVPMLLRIVKYGGIGLQGATHPGAYMSAAWALGEIGSAEAVPSLIKLWELKNVSHEPDGSHSALPSIFMALGTIGDARAVPLLLEGLEHTEEEIRYAAAAALGKIGGRNAVASLIAHLDDIIGFPLYNDDPESYVIEHRDVPVGNTLQNYPLTVAPVLRPIATVREAVLQALPLITKESHGGSAAEQVAAWKKWWEKHAGEYR